MANKATVLNHEVELWRQRCPLRLWLNGRAKAGKPVRVAQIAARVGYTRFAVYSWLAGVAIPKAQIIHKLRSFTGITLEAWLRWWDEKPRPGGGETCDSISTHSGTAWSGGD